MNYVHIYVNVGEIKITFCRIKSGEYYCSGNDLRNFTRIAPETNPQKTANDAQKVLKYVSNSMSFPVSKIPQSSVYLWATSVLQKHQRWYSAEGLATLFGQSSYTFISLLSTDCFIRIGTLPSTLEIFFAVTFK